MRQCVFLCKRKEGKTCVYVCACVESCPLIVPWPRVQLPSPLPSPPPVPQSATAGVPGHHLVQASVAWAYGVMEQQMASWKWVPVCACVCV